MTKQPKQCTHPDCFTCPYDDCIFEQMTVEEYLDSIKRDKEYSEPEPPPEYKQRSFDNSGRKEYFRTHYQRNREHKLQVSREYRQRTKYKCKTDRREYYKQYYQAHKVEKIRQVTERNRRIKEALNATG